MRAIPAPSPAQGPDASRREPVGASEHRPNSPEKQGRKDTQMVSQDTISKEINEREVEALVADIIPLIDSMADAKWAVGEVLVKRIHGSDIRMSDYHNGRNGWFATTARLLAEAGREVSETTLRSYYRTALAFPTEERVAGVGWMTHRVIAEAGPSDSAPERMAKLLHWCEAKGVKPTKREAQAFLGQPVNGQVGEPGAKAYIEAHPEVIVKAVTENPEIAKAIAADPDAHLAVERERNKAQDAAPRAPKAKDAPPMGLSELLLIGVIAADAQKVVTALTAVNTEGRAFTDEARTIVNGYADEAIALLNNAKAIVNGEVRTHLTDADFDALLTGGER